MKSGKSKALLEEIRDFNSDCPSCTSIVIKPSIDTRDGAFIKSRATDLVYPALLIDEDDHEQVDEMLHQLYFHDVLFIDEVQFFSLELLQLIIDTRIPIVASGLLFDYKGDFFPSSSLLMLESDLFKMLDGTCDDCDGKGDVDILLDTLTGQDVKGGNSVLIEGSDSRYQFKTLCMDCYMGVSK
jgi:thymidine kinase